MQAELLPAPLRLFPLRRPPPNPPTPTLTLICEVVGGEVDGDDGGVGLKGLTQLKAEKGEAAVWCGHQQDIVRTYQGTAAAQTHPPPLHLPPISQVGMRLDITHDHTRTELRTNSPRNACSTHLLHLAVRQVACAKFDPHAVLAVV